MPRPDRRPAPDNLPDCHDRIEELEDTLRATIRERRTNSAWASIGAVALQRAQEVLGDQHRDVRIEIVGWLRATGSDRSLNEGAPEFLLAADAIERADDRLYAAEVAAKHAAEVASLRTSLAVATETVGAAQDALAVLRREAQARESELAALKAE